MKTCPFCAESIQDAAIKCKHCKEWLPETKDETEKDELYAHAVELVQISGQASIYYLQRRLRIGYNKAARLLKFMEDDRIVGPASGDKPRTVLRGNIGLDSTSC